jgi:dynein heavy chain
MAALQFEKNLDITCCFDSMKEKIPFEYEEVGHVTAQGKTIINPKDSGGNVEEWLVEVEVMMRKSLANIIDKAMVDYAKVPRLEWICKWQGQVMLAGNQTMWTAQVEKAIVAGSVKQLGDALQTGLLETVVLVRGDLNKAQRTSIGALIVLDVHNRDATKELAVLKIERSADFDWQSQMRYYWIDGRESALTGLPASLHVTAVPHDQRQRAIRLRISGQQRPPRHHPLDRPLLPHAAWRHSAQPRRCP